MKGKGQIVVIRKGQADTKREGASRNAKGRSNAPESTLNCFLHIIAGILRLTNKTQVTAQQIGQRIFLFFSFFSTHYITLLAASLPGG